MVRHSGRDDPRPHRAALQEDAGEIQKQARGAHRVPEQHQGGPVRGRGRRVLEEVLRDSDALRAAEDVGGPAAEVRDDAEERRTLSHLRVLPAARS